MLPALSRALELANKIETFPLGNCGPSDDPDKQTAFVYAFLDIVKPFIAASKRIGNPDLSKMIMDLNTSPEIITEAYDLKADLLGIIDYLREMTNNSKSGQPTIMEYGQAWNPLRSALQNNFSFYDIKEIVGLAGLDLAEIAHLEQKERGGATKGQLMTGIDKALNNFDEERRKSFIAIIAEEIISRNPNIRKGLEYNLARLGFGLAENAVIPLDLFDTSDLPELPVESRDDLVKAAQRLRDGDLSGALSAACGAVDAATLAVYKSFSLGDPGEASFQEKCKKALNTKGVFVGLEQELSSLGWEERDIVPFKKNFEGALNQGAYVMQTLRSKMGDVHGTKPILKPMVFDSLKWAELIVRALQNK